MDEIQHKYVISHFKERSSKQKAVKFENIDLEVYKPSAKCAAFITSEERILHWIRTFQFRYFESLKDDENYYIEWIDHENYDSSSFQEIEIKIFKIDHEVSVTDVTQDSEPASDSTSFVEKSHTLLITIHIYLTTGVIMFQGYAFKFWTEKEFPFLQELTNISVLKHDPVQKEQDEDASHTKDVEMPHDKALLQNLADALGTLPSKKVKSKAKKTNQAIVNQDNGLVNSSSTGCETPLNRKRRNSFDSISGLSAKRTATVSELKFVVSNLESEVTEINNVLQSYPMMSFFEDKISILEDKISQIVNSSKINYQSLNERTNELEMENQSLKNENIKIKNELQHLRKQLQAYGKKQRDVESRGEETEAQDDKHEAPSLHIIPDDIPIENRYSVLEEEQEKVPIHATGTPNRPTATPDPVKPTECDDIVLLIDSNGKFIDPNKFSYNKRLRKIFCPTIASVTKTLSESDLGIPSHIIIHVGTNDIEHNPPDSCQSQFQEMVRLTAQKYPSSKVLISSLLKRSDDKDTLRMDLNAKLGPICVPFPNVHVVNNENIPEDYLYDKKHLKKRKIGTLVSNLKDVIFNRMRQNRMQPSRIPTHHPSPNYSTKNPALVSRQHYHDASMTSGSVAQPRLPVHPPGLSNQPTVDSNPHLPSVKPSYAAVVNMPPTVAASPVGLQSSAGVDMNTVLGLLKLYESMRHS